MNQLLTNIKLFFSKEYWKNDLQIQSDVSFWRRLFAFIFDSLIGASILIFFYLFIEPVVSSEDLSFILFIILVFSYIFIDYWILPNKTGFTISRWIFGYQILETNDKFPRIITLFKRGLALWVINFLTIDIASLFTIIIRKDKRAVHDILSKTKTKRTIKRLLFLRLILITFLITFMYLGGIKAALKSFSTSFVTPQIECLEEDLKSKSSIINLKEIPIEKGIEKYYIKNSKFYIYNRNNEITTSDSGIIFNDLDIKVKTSNLRINFAKDYNTLKWLPFNNFFSKIFSMWSSEELIRLTLEEANIDLLKRLPLTQPIKNVKRVYANFFLSTISRNYKNSIQQGYVHSPSSGFYAWIMSEKYNVVTFDLLEADTMNNILYVMPHNRKDIAMYLLNNTGIEK